MHIMTKDGWKPLIVKTEPIQPAPEMYSGPIPSFECQSFIRQGQKEHDEWQARRKAMMED